MPVIIPWIIATPGANVNRFHLLLFWLSKKRNLFRESEQNFTQLNCLLRFNDKTSQALIYLKVINSTYHTTPHIQIFIIIDRV